MKKESSIHTSRTMMFSELSKVMDHAVEDDSYLDSLQLNIANKKTKSNQDKTTKYLTQLYIFDSRFLAFQLFKHFWDISETKDRPLLAILYAIRQDFLLAESSSVIENAHLNQSVTIEKFDDNIVAYHPGRYSNNTRKSAAQNVASSWKQAGFITGKIKNIRTQPNFDYHVVVFAFLMAYCNGERGDFIISSKWVKALCLGDSQIREMAVEAAKRDLLQYQFAGNVTAISFTNLFIKLGVDGI